MHRRYYILYVCVFYLAGCAMKTKEQRFMEFIADPSHGIFQTKKTGGIEVTVKYIPASYNQLIQSSTSITSQSVWNEYNYFQFIIHYPTNAIGNKEKSTYLNFDIERDFFLSNGKDSLPAIFCQKIADGASNTCRYIVAFENSGDYEKADFNFIYTDRVFGAGTLNFPYRQTDIARIPKIN